MSEIEEVLCVRSAVVDMEGFPANGFISDSKDTRSSLGRILQRAEFLTRTPELEADENWLQLIPYVLLNDASRILLYRRGKSGSESRLHGKLTIGAGGHVNPLDGEDPAVTLVACMQREVAEEFGEGVTGEAKFVGILRNDASPVSRVHLAVVYRFDVKPGSEFTYAPEIEPLAWLEPEALGVQAEANWEDWSRMLLPFAHEILEGTADLL